MRISRENYLRYFFYGLLIPGGFFLLLFVIEQPIPDVRVNWPLYTWAAINALLYPFAYFILDSQYPKPEPEEQEHPAKIRLIIPGTKAAQDRDNRKNRLTLLFVFWVIAVIVVPIGLYGLKAGDTEGP